MSGKKVKPKTIKSVSKNVVLKLVCEWDHCMISFEEMTCFIEHVTKHLRDLGLSVIPKEDLDSQEGDFKCHWRDCGHRDVFFQSLENLIRHVYFHAFHVKLKSVGANLMLRNEFNMRNCCALNRNTIPDLPEMFTCNWNDCGVTYDNPELFYQHAAAHCDIYPKGNLPPGGCRCFWMSCEVVVKNKHKLKEHLRSHSKEKMMSCPTCGSLFSNATKFFDHLQRQLEGSAHNYQCSHCNKCYSSERLLRDHMRHHVENPVKVKKPRKPQEKKDSGSPKKESGSPKKPGGCGSSQRKKAKKRNPWSEDESAESMKSDLSDLDLNASFGDNLEVLEQREKRPRRATAAKVKYNFGDDENSNRPFNSDDDDEDNDHVTKPIHAQNFNQASEAEDDSQGGAGAVGLTDDDDDDDAENDVFGANSKPVATTIPKKTIAKAMDLTDSDDDYMASKMSMPEKKAPAKKAEMVNYSPALPVAPSYINDLVSQIETLQLEKMELSRTVIPAALPEKSPSKGKRKELESAKKQLVITARENSRLKEELDVISVENESLRKQVEANVEETEMLRTRFEATLTELKIRLDATTKEFEKLKEEKETAVRRNDSLLVQLDAAAAEMDAMKTQLNVAMEVNVEWRKQADVAAKEISQLRNGVDATKRENELLTEQLNAMTKENIEMKDEICQLNTALSEKRMKEMECELDELRAALEIATHELKRLQKVNENVNVEIKKLENENILLLAERNTLSERIARLESQVKELESKKVQVLDLLRVPMWQN